jgi:hypothetical protein
MFCHERLNVQKQEWSDIQLYLDNEPYLLPKGLSDPQNRKLGQLKMHHLSTYFKKREGCKKARVSKVKEIR